MPSIADFESYLKPGESILWTGQPKPGIQIRDADMILIPMSIILIGFSIILNYTLFHYRANLILLIFAIAIGIAGIYGGALRFFSDAAKRARTHYCITTHRVIVLTAKQKPAIKTLPLKNIDRMDITEEKDGSGFIIFGNTNPLYPWLLGGFYFSHDAVPGLELLPDAKLVYNILQKQIKVELPVVLEQQIKNQQPEDLN